MKAIHKLMMIYGMMGLFAPDSYLKTAKKELTPEELERINYLREQRKIEILKNKGLREWEIDGIKIIALNYKNALRKAKNIKEIQNILRNERH